MRTDQINSNPENWPLSKYPNLNIGVIIPLTLLCCVIEHGLQNEISSDYSLESVFIDTYQ